ncbi:galactoside O-acetyltransferase [Paenibacillus sp. CCS19]|uniref:acyltransferase n=1 Tax=Paenibacillus sp. CCS19 TaxID=3158387 RepID=UPI0025601513|nr:acyltransferase [Paenibacillus cellulosilyticus]GMK38141.1 galactoside O-acetyltransferase [Paenibacillus cellulosilyticus]
MNIFKLFIRYRIKHSSPSKRAQIIKRTSEVSLGAGCEVYDNVSFGSEPYLIQIGDNVRITKGVTFITHDGGVWVLRNNGMLVNSDKFGTIKVGSNVHIGINATIMPGVNIGDNVIIGVGAVVTKDVPSNSIAAGVPAKVIKSLEEYYEKCKETADFTKVMNYSEKREYLIKKYNL